jgi:molecular chaperone HscB
MDINQSHFALFGLPERFALDRARLDGAYREVLGEVHPDRFARAGAADQRVALQWATRANEAYRTLRDDVARARYLCELRGIALAVETNTAMPAAFLVEQMELREALDEAREARDEAALKSIGDALRTARARAIAEVAGLLDGQGGTEATAHSVRKLMFLDRFGIDVAEALDAVDPVDSD